MRNFRGDLLSLGLDVLNVSNHVEGVRGEVVVLSVEDGLERSDGVLERDETTLDTGEDLGDSERLRKRKGVSYYKYGTHA